jgi:hypothetical protein
MGSNQCTANRSPDTHKSRYCILIWPRTDGFRVFSCYSVRRSLTFLYAWPGSVTTVEMTRSSTWQTFRRWNQLNLRCRYGVFAARELSDWRVMEAAPWMTAIAEYSPHWTPTWRSIEVVGIRFSELQLMSYRHSIDDSWIPNFGMDALRKPKIHHQRNITSI